MKTYIEGKKEEATIEDVLSRGLQGLLLSDLPRDLPADLANLDVEAVLPKLSTLPLGSKEYAQALQRQNMIANTQERRPFQHKSFN